ncbi:hypothetical protein A2Z00_05410 [Candidatus Gottesmanbacteria bacterium RBG_13_45_10]|uniref:Uncharacterized protein n=1 Tax=Candidatus Gottesmanbacteria bacterium RBG_13_45_10 TaxID=1798370 RepID=A0A1F5ZH52_9BACT|nr:MAG: hypothetical protein A2Z00_05410 [Candidatus Gottesmanbacteria bacterium RBG_13_45_10]
MNKQQLIVLIIITLIAFLGVVLFTQIRKQANVGIQTSPSPTISQTLPPPFPSPVADAPLATYDTSLLKEAFPTSVPAYTVVSVTALEGAATRMANVLGFSGKPTIAKSPKGTYYSWANQLTSVVIGPDAQFVDFSSPTPKSLSPLTDPDAYFALRANTLISSLFPNLVVSTPTYAYYAPTQDSLNYTQRSNATAIEISYQPLLNNLPIFTLYPFQSKITIRYGSDKSLLYLSAPIYPPFNNSGSIMNIATLDEVKQKLSANQGVILYAYALGDENSWNPVRYSFSTIKITNAELAYYFDFARSSLSPIYVFYGTAPDVTTGKTVNIEVAASATP